MVLAHEGGWDELLLVSVPLVVFAVLLLVAGRRAKARRVTEPEPQD